MIKQVEHLLVAKDRDGDYIFFIDMLLHIEQSYNKNMKKWTHKDIIEYLNTYVRYILRVGKWLLIDAYFLVDLTKAYIKYLKGGR